MADLPDPLRSDPETERYRLFDAVASWLAEASTESPLLLVLDDLHWAAKPTVLLLRHVLRSSEPLRMLVVGTYRDTDIGRGHPLTEFLADLRRSTASSAVHWAASTRRPWTPTWKRPPGTLSPTKRKRACGRPCGGRPKAIPSSWPRCAATWSSPGCSRSGTDAATSPPPSRRWGSRKGCGMSSAGGSPVSARPPTGFSPSLRWPASSSIPPWSEPPARHGRRAVRGPGGGCGRPSPRGGAGGAVPLRPRPGAGHAL